MGMRSTFGGVLLPMTLSFVPGWGHIWLHRKQLGLGLFMLFVAALNLALLFRFLSDWKHGIWVVQVAWATAAATLVFSIYDTFRATIWSKMPGTKRRRRRYLRRTVRHYLRDEHGRAEEAATRMLRMNPIDTTALVYLAMVQEGAGRKKVALETWKRAKVVDANGRWQDDIARQIALLKRRGKS
ncbi:MAG: hypothetical protein V3W41_19810 [Planctomycetota bacterium]